MHESPLILHLIPTLALGGAERVVVELAARLPEEGFRTKVVALFEGGTFADDLRERDVRWAQILPSTSGSRIELISRLRGMMREESPRRPAIVHTHLFGGDFYGAIATQSIWAWGMGHPIRRPTPDARRPHLISTAHNIDRDDSSLRRIARRWAVRRMEKVVAISGAVARYAKRNLGVREDRILVIPNGVDTSAITSRGDRPFHDVPHLLIVGRLEKQKGHGALFDALAHVSPPWRLDVAGTGSLERDLRERAERLGIASRVRFLGVQRDVGALLADADLFCFPSQWEGMGLALVEALSAGVPVLASDLFATREIVPASRLVDPTSAKAWTKAIQETIKESSKAVTQAQKLEGTIRGKYGVERMVGSYAEMYRHLLNLGQRMYE